MDKLKLYNLDAEKNILSSIFSDSSVIDIISVFLKKRRLFLFALWIYFSSYVRSFC